MENRKEQNLGAATTEPAAEDVRDLEGRSSKIKLEGARYSKFHEQLVGRCDSPDRNRK